MMISDPSRDPCLTARMAHTHGFEASPSIATVVDSEVRVLYEEGRIAAVREGRAIITVTAERISDFLTVTVTRR